jgi:poly-gamma-glutamate synthesis protein (capsule biosynthesis protein)
MIKLLIAGDLVPLGRVASLIEAEKYEEIFEQVHLLTQEQDYSIVNLEAPIVINDAKPIDKYGPHLKCKKNVLKSIQYAGFNCVSLANNHIRDYGDEGVIDTLSSCLGFGIDVVGAGVNLDEASKILYKNIKNKKIAIVNFCENEFSIATKQNAGANPLNIVANYYKIHETKQNADYVIVIIHGGHEHYQLPSPRMKETYRFFAEAGANVIINHHQHCYSGYEVYKNIPIFYGLGNFCFENEKYKNTIWNEGYLVQLFITNDNIKFDLLPYIQCKDKSNVEFLENKILFDNEINRLNKIISDDKALWDNFINLINERKQIMLLPFEPYTNRYLKGLHKRGLIPSLVSNKRKKMLFNFISCESHKDVLLGSLKK